VTFGERASGLIPARAGRTFSPSAPEPRTTAHPRSRGADIAGRRARTAASGSSPLARGGRGRPGSRSGRVRLIPARAGRTLHSAKAPTVIGGSSPLARGGPCIAGDDGREGRLIPARAGRTPASAVRVAAVTAHPRSRGADLPAFLGGASRWGSSPLARGGPRGSRHEPPRQRLIPARAGRTDSCQPGRVATPAHPRSRGADFEVPLPALCCGRLIPARAGRTGVRRGLDGRIWAHPRSRGADSRRSLTPPISPRLIPARAGRTGCPARRLHDMPAHPRSRGADGGTALPTCSYCGSSPLARGGPLPHLRQGGSRRLIPARAGRTSQGRTGQRGGPAHPRSRGADGQSRELQAYLTGSSPLARGGLDHARDERRRARLIPARAGRTARVSSRLCIRRAHPRSRGADSSGTTRC